jgi:hypothetical protein
VVCQVWRGSDNFCAFSRTFKKKIGVIETYKNLKILSWEIFQLFREKSFCFNAKVLRNRCACFGGPGGYNEKNSFFPPRTISHPLWGKKTFSSDTPNDLTPFPRLLILLQLFLTSREISKSYMSILCDQDFTGSEQKSEHNFTTTYSLSVMYV